MADDRTLGTIRFTLRVDKVRKTGLAPIELTYSISGKRKVVNTGLFCFPYSWNGKEREGVYLNNEKVKVLYPEIPFKDFPSEKEIKELNNELAIWSKKVSDAETLLKAQHKDGITSEMVTEYIKEKREANKGIKKEEPKKYLLDFIRNSIAETSAITNKSTQKARNTLATHLENYQNNVALREGKDGKLKLVKLGSKRKPIALVDADYSFMQSFFNYLIGGVGHLNTTASKQITNVKAFLNKARKSGYEVNNTFQDFTIKRDKLEVLALTQEEFDRIINLDLSDNSRLDKVRDVFVFGCVTGLRYSDLANLKRDNVKDGFLDFTVVKTRQQLSVPLSGIAYDVLDKYKHTLRPLPVISNQKTNEYVKEICKMAEINEIVEITRFRGAERETNSYPKHELITVHTARKTFVTLSLERGMKAEEIMPITGHASYESFKRYLNVTKTSAQTALLNAWGVRTLKVVKGGTG